MVEICPWFIKLPENIGQINQVIKQIVSQNKKNI